MLESEIKWLLSLLDQIQESEIKWLIVIITRSNSEIRKIWRSSKIFLDYDWGEKYKKVESLTQSVDKKVWMSIQNG